jgi:hypothetical protein
VKNEDRAKKDIKKKTKENTQLIVDLNALKFQDKRQEINQQKKNLELEMLQAKLAKLKKYESGARAELAAMQSGQEERPASTRMQSANTREKSDKAAEEDQDKQRIGELLT